VGPGMQQDIVDIALCRLTNSESIATTGRHVDWASLRAGIAPPSFAQSRPKVRL
jgi:hypothetical protein